MKILFLLVICIGELLLMAYIVEPSKPLSRKDIIRSEAERQAITYLEEKYGFVLCGAGGGNTDEGIWLIATSFFYQHDPIVKQEARKLAVDCVDEFLNIINASEELRPYLRDVPFTPKNVAIRIFLLDTDGRKGYHPFIDSISAVEGRILYLTQDTNDEYNSKMELMETYEQAVEILRKEHQNLDSKDI
jgi:hypothetical protein